MKPATLRVLSAINSSFYSSPSVREFSAVREAPWPGWDRVFPAAPESGKESSVFDVGCGNGRLAAYLVKRWGDNFSYLGVDASGPLIEVAGARGLDSTRVKFSRIEMEMEIADVNLPSGAFSIIALFGVLHHVPGFAQRVGLVDALLRRLQPNGRLIVTFWRFGCLERFRRKIPPWRDYNESHGKVIDINDLEAGDYLVRWGADGEIFRYCHFANEEEVETLLASIKARCVDRFLSDGREGNLNQYLVLTS